MNLSLRLGWRNLWRHPRRTWLTTGAMIFSNVLLVFMISLQLGMYQLMIDNSLRIFTGHLQVQAPGYNDTPHMSKTVPDIKQLAAKLREVSGNGNVAARASGFALFSSAERSYGAMVIGVEAEYEPGVSSLPGLIKQGRYLNNSKGAEVVLGAALARNLKVSLHDELTLMGSGKDGSFAADVVNVVGIFETGVPDIDRNFVQMPLDRFQEVFSMENEGHTIVALAEDFSQIAQLQQRLQKPLSDTEKLVLLDWDALSPGLQQAIDADMASAWFMYGILILLVAFSVLNTQLMSVLERTHEFGIIMALGLKPGRLGRMVLMESTIMAGMGFVIGTALGSLVALYFHTYGLSLPGMEDAMARYNLPGRMYPSTSMVSLCLGPAVVFIACILASAYPALRLYRLHPIDAMRSA